MIYMSRSVLHAYSWSSVADSGYGLWVAQYLYKYYDETNGIDGYVTDPDRGTCTLNGIYYDWEGDDPDIFERDLEKYIDWYNNVRIKRRLDGSSPVEYRLSRAA